MSTFAGTLPEVVFKVAVPVVVAHCAAVTAATIAAMSVGDVPVPAAGAALGEAAKVRNNHGKV